MAAVSCWLFTSAAGGFVDSPAVPRGRGSRRAPVPAGSSAGRVARRHADCGHTTERRWARSAAMIDPCRCNLCPAMTVLRI
jgi:hypothetical protein